MTTLSEQPGEDDAVWVRCGDLRVGDRQIFTHKIITAAIVNRDQRHTEVWYDEIPPREWANGTQVMVLTPRPDGAPCCGDEAGWGGTA